LAQTKICKMIRDFIVLTALSLVGEREKILNINFSKEKFEDYKRRLKLTDGQVWNTYFTELVWIYAYQQYDPSMVKKLNKLFDAGAVNTWRNFLKSDFLVSNIPVAGDIVIWQNFINDKPCASGHAGIVVQVNLERGFINSAETNHDCMLSGTINVQVKTRYLKEFERNTGLVMKGFIKPFDIR